MTFFFPFLSYLKLPDSQRQFDTSTTAGDDSCLSSELDLLNPKVTQSCHNLRFTCGGRKNEESDRLNLLKSSSRSSYCYRQPVVNRQIIEAKLLTRKADQIATSQYISNIGSSESYFRLRKHEPQVTFEDKHSNESERFDRKFNEKLWRLMYCADNRKENSTPRIVRVIRQNSRKLDPKVDRSTTFDQPRADNSKNSVVVLYHGRSSTSPSASSKALVRLSKSDQTVIEKLQPEVARSRSASPDKPKIIETPESLSPRYPLRRRRTTSRKYRRVSRHKHHSFNVNIYQPNPVERIVSPLQRHHWTVSKSQIKIDPNYNESGCIAEPNTDCSVKLQEKKIIDHANENAINQKSQRCVEEKRIRKKQCSAIRAVASKFIDHRPKQVKDAKNQKQSMQKIQTNSEEANVNSTFISVNEGNESSRVFPFQATPSGNLKIVPNQVVFESKKFSVLVADPQHTKVNVKAELNRSDVGTSVFESSTQTRYIDLPPGVTQSTINKLQAQKKLPYIEANYRSRTQPSAKFNVSKMESQPTSYQLPLMDEVPLASLGFTNEQPINWNNIILPEKTDLYQELARRITNYKNADCIVRIDQDEFYCHLLVLQSYSAFFDAVNYKDLNLSSSKVTSKAFNIIYDWMISPINESYHLLRRDNILEVFMAAQYLGIKELEEQCWAFIDNDELFSEDTAFLLYLEAKKIGNTAVMELMIPRIMKFFLMLVSTKDFLELSVDELCSLLKSNYICVNSEIEVLMSAVRWLMHDWNERKQHMLEVLKCVRFGLIAPWQLVDVKRNPENPEFMELMAYPEVQKMVDDGLAFVIIKYWYGNQTENYYHWIDLLGLSEPINRNWAGQDKNYVTYREFLLYLEEYQKSNILELKARNTRTIPTPPNSPPKDSSSLSERTHVDCNQNHCCVESHPLEQYTTTQIKTPKKYVSKVSTSSGIVISPEVLTECFNNMGRNNNIRANKAHGDGNRNSISVVEDSRCLAGDKLRGKSLDFLKNEKHTYKYHQREISMPKYEGQEKNVSDVYSRKQWEQNATLYAKKLQKCMKKLNYAEDCADSVKSEEEAATMIQATYRGYKVRRKFDEIKKLSAGKKQNAQKVAELLSVSTSQPGWQLHKSLNLVKMCNSVTNQNKNALHYI
ncbi:LOW QUALITY PROTEIN: uncharacterized protein LOC114939506 [Nylanderia fulva]|uniref:LOW QUALITY PROTEIN: uncharacterized protein LOC114939506 n=1 Tax=Nylanderia fulva TaxID=613905 RepID=UPI0010FB2608|nr:LOW QUALITY PROTEIN: uncharacterized protein LOC114939506 [Nylanderia fulva]